MRTADLLYSTPLGRTRLWSVGTADDASTAPASGIRAGAEQKAWSEPRQPQRRMLLLAAVLLLGHSASALAQGVGQPLRLHQTWNGPTTLAIDFSHGGLADGAHYSATLSRAVRTGHCPGLVVAAEGGRWNPAGSDIPAATTFGVQASWLLNRCPTPLSSPDPTVRVQAGLGWVSLDGESRSDLSLGLGLGWSPLVAGVRLQPWAMSYVRRQTLSTNQTSTNWRLAGSAGFVVGLAGTAGLTATAACCEGGLGGRYGLSLWF